MQVKNLNFTEYEKLEAQQEKDAKQIKTTIWV
jgi:hypothetical protein